MELIQVAIFENHTSVIDGYYFRLNQDPDIKIVATARDLNELETTLNSFKIDLLISRVSLPLTLKNSNYISILPVLPRYKKEHPNLKVLIISQVSQPYIIKSEN